MMNATVVFEQTLFHFFVKVSYLTSKDSLDQHAFIELALGQAWSKRRTMP